ncbi:MAG TPA: molybdate ABC transporter substrate-binding protein [Steroidobacteraceae bacterium]|nr:molybdate ABC transporter substrate-binding protein [Steroidobacteraceae bacterium]
MQSASPLRVLLLWVVATFLTAAAGTVPARAAGTVMVFGAASLTEVMGEMSAAYTQRTKIPIKASYAASSVLARQIVAGAKADLFFSADVQWMDYLDTRQLLRPGSRHEAVGNQLVLIAPADSRVSVRLAPGANLGAALGPQGKLAIGDPDSVPAGIYARAALRKLGMWNSLYDRIVGAENVRAALAYVARGEAPLGIVYRTDALAEKRVRIVAQFPPNTHPPIVYPIALTIGADSAAAEFEDFILHSREAQALFSKYGFEPLH